MSDMLAEISRIVAEDISIRTNQYDVLHDAIINAIQANATKITCILSSNDNLLEANGTELTENKVDTITIIDNGNGMNQENYESFCKYRTNHKKELGCKGVGRFIFLKLYKTIKYKSLLVESQEERTFTFTLDFDTDKIKTKKVKVDANETQVEFSQLTDEYYHWDTNTDRRITLNVQTIKDRVLINLIPTLYFYKKKKAKIEIEFINKETKETIKISEEDIPDFIKKDFIVYDKAGHEFTFILNYKINNIEGKLQAFYCAGYRTVCAFSEKDLNLTLPFKYSGYFLLEAKYLETRVNNSRNDFRIYPRRTDEFTSLSWQIINSTLKREVSDILKKTIPETEKINSDKLKIIQEERPYLINYIEESDIDMAGYLDKDSIINNAKRKFDVEKERILTNAGKESYTDKELNDAIQIAQNELVSYVNDRAQVLERLRKMVDKKEKVEKIIHNLFMEQNTEDDYFCIGKNNLWLLDDRFTTYSYAASNKRITDVLTKIGETDEDVENEKDKPDLSLFFSHNPNNPERLKSVLIEIKPFDYDSKADRKKFQGVQQLVDYVEAFKTAENIEEIFAFLITDIDAKLAARLKKDDYLPLFSTDTPIFYRFFKELDISIYVIGVKTLIADAEARNKIFLDIIKKQSKLNKLLEKGST